MLTDKSEENLRKCNTLAGENFHDGNFLRRRPFDIIIVVVLVAVRNDSCRLYLNPGRIRCQWSRNQTRQAEADEEAAAYGLSRTVKIHKNGSLIFVTQKKKQSRHKEERKKQKEKI
ncbi:hypothetical protein NECAME_14317 [Necator americanus]|uniref:Uncharacterized protein n=1 Tax=Necator americanus TaxID=51031 RepID=W2SP41_NECAM|nr:hypothetical protein NECAME_14317 [Necator americanus]ETN71263.1 hypothetical protein NECAME_14317 [Necator americanus]